jgi:LacI family transcriptional regulator
MATLVEVSRKAGVSIATVSNVITGAVRVSPELQKRVLIAIEELDYHPNFVARSLKMQRTRLLGMVISDITNPFFPLLVRGAEDAALERNYLLITFNSDDRVEREAQMLSVLRSRRVDGILLVMAPNAEEPKHIKNLLRSGIPLVLLDRPPVGFQADSVCVDNVGGAFACVEHLLSLGHRKIGAVTGPMSMQIAIDRYQGYKNALLAAGVEPDPQMAREGDFRVESGYLLGKEWLRQADRPSALFVSNYNMAMGLMGALEELGLRCPGDLALTVFDDLPPAVGYRSHLTAVSNPAYTLGQQGVELLLNRIEKKELSPEPIAILLKSELVVRESSGVTVEGGDAQIS